MQAENFSLQQYLDRIGFQKSGKADIETITDMMRCQLFTVPFENLDVQAKKVVSLIPGGYRGSITRLQYPLPTLQVVRYRTRMQGSLPAGG